MRKTKIAILLSCMLIAPSFAFSSTYLMQQKVEGVKYQTQNEISFSADKTSITKGASFALTWNITGKYDSIEISGLGSVSASGTRTITPTTSGIYTITVSINGEKTEKSINYSVINPASCKTIYDSLNGAATDGYYTLSTKNGNVSYYCDMAGGGYTLLTNITPTSSSAGTFVLYSGTWRTRWGSAASAYRDRTIYSNMDGIPWSTAKINILPNGYSTLDGWNNTHASYNRGVLSGMIFDGLEITRNAGSTVNHVFGITRDIYSNIGDVPSRRTALGIPLDQMSYTYDVDTKYTYTVPGGASVTDVIQLRGINDQGTSDEDLGFKYYNVYVK